MNTVPSPPARPNPAARPLLALDRDALRLSSPRGDAVSGFMTLTNRGEAPLEGTILARVGGEWLRIEPAVGAGLTLSQWGSVVIFVAAVGMEAYLWRVMPSRWSRKPLAA